MSKQIFTPVLRVKKKPRGRSFEKGNGFGSEHRFKKGQPSANPGGRPRCKEISKALRERLAAEKAIPAKTGAEKLAKEWYEQSLGGNIMALVSLADRVEGRPAQSIQFDDREDPLNSIIAGFERMSLEIGPPDGSHPRLLGAGDEEDEDDQE